MAGAKLSPRQRMIGLMYLVLTALLALNVSKDIINAFVTINSSLEVSRKNLDASTTNTYGDFEMAMANDPVKTKPFYDNAQSVKKMSDELVGLIEGMKTDLINMANKVEDPPEKLTLDEVKRKDDRDIPTNYMCGTENDGEGAKATELKEKMDAYKANILPMLKILPSKIQQDEFESNLQQYINTDDPAPSEVVDGKRTWEMKNFYQYPIVGTVAILTKMQTDVKNYEASLSQALLRSINMKDFKIDALVPKVIAPTSYVLLGQEYTADVFLAAVNTTSNPEIVVTGSDKALPVEAGMGKFSSRPSSEGLKKWGGVIKVKKPDNTVEEYPFESEYIAARPTSVVSADKMNVLYIGVDNPMSISVPGVPMENVTHSVTGGGVLLKPDPKLGKGKFIATAKSQGEAKIRVSAKFDGGTRQMGEFNFRVKRIPDPVAMVANKKEGSVNKNELAAQSAIIPVLENFDFEAYYTVTGFTLARFGKGRDPIYQRSDNNRITPEMVNVINQCRTGDKVYFENIKARGPDGTTRSLSSVNFTIQ